MTTEQRTEEETPEVTPAQVEKVAEKLKLPAKPAAYRRRRMMRVKTPEGTVWVAKPGLKTPGMRRKERAERARAYSWIPGWA
jgi:hypothetical protein